MPHPAINIENCPCLGAKTRFSFRFTHMCLALAFIMDYFSGCLTRQRAAAKGEAHKNANLYYRSHNAHQIEKI